MFIVKIMKFENEIEIYIIGLKKGVYSNTKKIKEKKSRKLHCS